MNEESEAIGKEEDNKVQEGEGHVESGIYVELEKGN